MGRLSADNYVTVNPDIIRQAIDKVGISLDKLSSMVLKQNTSYISKALNRRNFEVSNLRTLCDFLSINYDDVVVKEETKSVVQMVENKSDSLSVAPLETIIVGLNLMYETQKKQAEMMEQLLVEIKALNVKQNRLENALGQLVQNSIITKENTNKVCETANTVRSQLNLANGRLKDLVDGVKKNEKTYKVV